MPRVLIIGGGVAGCSTGIFLAKAGVEVVVAERKLAEDRPEVPKIGESLPPEGRSLLEELGVWPSFLASGHLPCYSHRSYWGSGQVSHRDFLTHPLGHGWHLDRAAFDTMLERHCQESGARIFRGCRMGQPERAGKGWSTAEWGYFDFVVDASGRHSRFAAGLGIERIIEDRQLALVAFLQGENALEDTASLIESTDSGWWYSAAIPGNRLATANFARPDQFQRKQWRKEGGWWQLLSEAKHSCDRVIRGGFKLLAPPRFVPAESSILESLVGEGWLAVGDAAMSYDPIASHGIMMGMVSGRDAVLAITATFDGAQNALSLYDTRLTQAFYEYTRLRGALYAQLKQGTPSMTL